MPGRAGKASAAAMLLGLLDTALAYELDGGRWGGATTVFHVKIPGTSLSGTTWNAAFESAMNTWTNATDFTFQIDQSYLDPCQGYSRSQDASNTFPDGDGDLRNGVDFREDVCGNAFGDGVLAITLSYSRSGSLGFENIVESDIIFNSAFKWNVYAGVRNARADFQRVALHELGHTIGLNHELVNEAIMQPRISDLDQLTPDDIAGVNALYGDSTICVIRDLDLHAVVSNALETGDCRIQELFKTGNDTSFVDTYRIRLEKPTTLHVNVASSVMDPVLLVYTPQLKWLADFDDTATGCHVEATTTLGAGEYLLLVNTFTNPKKCGTNTGPYTLSVTDSALPLLGPSRNAGGVSEEASALFSAGASADGGQSFGNRFSATQAVDVSGRIGVDPLHQGLPGKVFVLVVLSDGRQFMKLGSGKFVPFSGVLTGLQPFRQGNLSSVEDISVVQGLRGDVIGLRGLSFTVYLGYALDSQPTVIHYGTNPLRFSIDP